MKQLKLYCTLLLFLLIHPIWGQYPFYSNYTINNGLPSNKIYNILEDRNGFIWICTDLGVSRFDGVNFVNYTSNEGLPDNEILGMFEDQKGRIWFNSFSSEPSYYFDGKIYNSSNEPFLKRVKEHKNDERNYLFIVQKNNSIAFLIQQNNTRWIVGKDIQDIEVKFTYEMRSYLFQNILYENTTGYHAISRLELLNWSNGDSVKLEDNGIWGISINYTKAPKRYIYGLLNKANSTNVIRFDMFNGNKTQFPISSKYNRVYDKNGEFLLTTEHSYSIVNDSFNIILKHVDLPFHFDHIYTDHRKNRWFCTPDNGLYFIHYNAPNNIALNYPLNRGIIAIQTTQNFIALRTEINGLMGLNLDGKTELKYLDTFHRRVRGFAETSTHNIIGSDGGIIITDKQFKHPIRLSVQAVKDIEPYSKDLFLIATANNCYIFENNSLTEIFNKRTYAICKIDEHILWLGGIHGIVQVIKKGNTFTNSTISLDPLLDKSRIVDIKCDKKGNIWIATDQKGVFFYSKKYGIKRFSQNSDSRYNLMSDVCFEIQVAEDNGIWLSTQNGICKINYSEGMLLSDFQLQNFSLSEGIPGKIVNSVAFLNNKILLATPDGVYLYNQFPSSIPDVSNTIITEVKINNQIFNNPLKDLPYYLNNIFISYSASFINTGSEYKFKYRVKELNNSWIETNTLQVPLLGLEPGNYTFEICAVNAQGKTGKLSVLNIQINPPWFKQLWFISLCIIIAISSIVYYLQLLKDKVKLSHDLILMRLRILRAQMNPHFVFNALSNIQQLIYLKEHNLANTYIGTLASIMRKSLDYSNKEYITLDKELEYTISYLEIEKLRFTDKFDYTIECLLDLKDQETLYVPPLLIQPMVENSIKHAFKGMQHKGQLHLKIEKITDKQIQYTIKDDGCGFDPKDVTLKDFGIGITKERIELLYKHMSTKGQFTVYSESKKGTTIIIKLPILKD